MAIVGIPDSSNSFINQLNQLNQITMDPIQQYNLKMVANQPEFKIGDLVMYDRKETTLPGGRTNAIFCGTRHYIIQDVVTGARWVPFDELEPEEEESDMPTGYWEYEVKKYPGIYKDSEDLQLVP